MAGCGCDTRARWLAVKLARLSIRFETQPTVALAQLLAIIGVISVAAVAGYCYAGHCYGASRSRS